MAQQPTLAPGVQVQINPSTDSARAGKPSPEEQGIGIIKQVFTAQGDQMYLVVWNPGDKTPKTGTYRAEQLTPLSQQQATNLTNQMNTDTNAPATPNASTNTY